MAEQTYDFAAAREGLISHPTNFLETLMHLVKGVMGGGILAMPYAFKFTGLFGGLVGLCFTTGVAAYGVYLLVVCAHEVYRRKEVPFLSYAEVAKSTFEIGPEKLQKFAKAAAFIVDLFLCIDLLGCCVSYTIFGAESIRQVVEHYEPESAKTFGVRWYIAFLLTPMMLLCLIRHLKYLAYFSMFANICMVIGFGCTFYYMFRPPLGSLTDRVLFKDPLGFPVFFGISLFALECIAVVMSLENNMRNPHQMTRIPGILCMSFIFAMCVYGAVGFSGYLKYGEAILASVTLNIPEDELLSQIVKLMVATAILLTYLLQFYVPLEVMVRHLENKYGELRVCYILLLREGICFLCVLIAWLVPSIGGIIAFLGALCLSVLGVILPAIFDLVLFKNAPYKVFRYMKDYFMICMGLFGLIVGTYMSIIEIIQDVWPELLGDDKRILKFEK